MRTTNESERILENLGKNERIRIRANLGETGVKNGRIWATMGKKWANETETWQNRAKPKVSPKLYSDSGIPGLDLTLSDTPAGNPEYVQKHPAGHILFGF